MAWTTLFAMDRSKPDPAGADPHHDRRLSLLQVRAARAGHTLQQVRTGYMLARGNHSKHCIDLDTVHALLQHMGV